MRARKSVYVLLAVGVWLLLFGAAKLEAADLEAGNIKKMEKEAVQQEDIYFEKKSQTFINGELAGPEKVMSVWLKGDRIRFESEDNKNQYTLILMDKGKTYELDKSQKTYREVSSEMDKLKEASERTTVVVSKRTGEKKKIKDWNCYQVLVETTLEGNKMKATCWLSEDIHVSPKAIEKMAKFSKMKMLEELVKYPGYPVEVTMDSTLQGKQVRVVSTLTKIVKGPIKAEFVQIPFEYTKIGL
ncbi:MAG: hypothetical protein K6U11_10655 [bacterium]|nr:hypothetical protein [bacterium]